MITTGTIYVIQARTTITGPNNAYRVVWALSEYFIKIYSCFTKILILFNRLFNKFQDEGTQTMRTCRLCPRWVYIYIYSCFFFYTNDCYRYYLHYTGKNNNNRPKRRVSRRLGTRWVFFLIYSCFSNIPTMLNRFFNKFQDEGTQTTCHLGSRARHHTRPRHQHITGGDDGD